MDRNSVVLNRLDSGVLSLSARRAWIEIIARFKRERKGLVALRKESVDRNRDQFDVAMSGAVALRKESVDRNAHVVFRLKHAHVALRKESVDRNIVNTNEAILCTSRSPQGERG